MDSESETELSRPLIIAVCCLAAAHLPFVLVQCRNLWALEHFQFFPFAIFMFGFLFRSRFKRNAFRWDLLNTALLAIDLLLLFGGILIASPLVVYVGAVLLCLIACRSCFDSEYNTSLAYLILILLITVRPPLGYDTKIIGWLQGMTTRVSSYLLDFMGYLHLRHGNVLEYPGKKFMVEEACSGVQSLFAVLFLACLIVCLSRRRWLHTGLVLMSAVGFAGLMNVVRICVIFIAWADSRVDLTTGQRHVLLGYLALTAAAFLVCSADAFWAIVFGPVPDVRGKGVSQIFRNPLIVYWNRLFHLRTRNDQTLKTIDLESQAWHSIALALSVVICVGALAGQFLAL